jgi:hypothetical protein
MFPEAPVDARRKKVGLLFGAGTSCTVVAFALLTGPSPHVGAFIALACVVIGNAGVIYFNWPRTDGFLVQVPGGRRSRSAGHGRSGGAGIVPGAAEGPGPVPRVGVGLRRMLRAAAGARSLLLVAALLMPSAAGRRWLAEAESLLFELAPGRRGSAIRSYLWSAPRLVVLMWASKLSRWIRSGR